mgnify:CR=1
MHSSLCDLFLLRKANAAQFINHTYDYPKPFLDIRNARGQHHSLLREVNERLVRRNGGY